MLLAHKSVASCNTSNHDVPPPTSIMPSLAFILSPHSPFYHHCFPSLRCRREEDCKRPPEMCTYAKNIIINATLITATAMHDKDPFQSYAPTMRGKQYSDQREPPPLRLSSTSSTSCLRSTILQIKWSNDTLQNGAPTTQNILLMQRPSQLILPSSEVSWFVVLSSSP